MPRCIYCGDTTGSERTVEHPFPEALGFRQALAPGVVHDRCNHALKRLDQEFCDYLPIRSVKIHCGVLGKEDHPRTLFAERGGFRHEFDPRRNHYQIRLASGQTPHKSGGSVSFDTPTLNEDSWYLSRAIHKIGLGLVALQRGPDAALDRRFDAARRYVSRPRSREERRRHGERTPLQPIYLSWLRSPKNAGLKVWVHPESGFVFFSYFGNDFLVYLPGDFGQVVTAGARFIADASRDRRPPLVMPDEGPLSWHYVVDC